MQAALSQYCAHMSEGKLSHVAAHIFYKKCKEYICIKDSKLADSVLQGLFMNINAKNQNSR